MVRKLIVPVTAVCALLLLPASQVSASPSSSPGPGWRQVLNLSPGQTSANTTVPMQAGECRLLLKVHPKQSVADCVTHYSITVTKGATPGPRADKMILAGFVCNVSVAGNMWNGLWYSYATVYFCWIPNDWTYAYYANCSNYGAYPGWTIAVTWCGPGSQGTSADGGDNVGISSVYGGYYTAGQREWFNVWGGAGVWCWQAYC